MRFFRILTLALGVGLLGAAYRAEAGPHHHTPHHHAPHRPVVHRTYTIFYRADPSSPWMRYTAGGAITCPMAASRKAGELSSRLGVETFIRSRSY
jgi:hypothetical protein